MLSILITTHSADGHVAPLLPVATHLVKVGHRVRFLTGSAYRETVGSTDAEFLPWPPDAVSSHESERSTTGGLRALAKNVERIFVKPAVPQYQAIVDALEQEHADVVITEFTVVGVAGLAWGNKPHPPVIACGIIPLGLSSKDTAPFGLGMLPKTGLLGQLRNRFLNAVTRHIILRRPQKLVEETLEKMGTDKFDAFFMDWPIRADIYAVFTVEGFEYPRSDIADNVRFVGPMIGTAARKGELPAWWGDLEGKTVVHVSQGTIATDPHELIIPTIKALANDDVLVVASTGGASVESLGELPANARAADFIPYSQLMPLVDVYVSNGGYGGLHHALSHGIPMVVAGETEDKAETTRRVEWSGVGVNLHTQHPTEEQVRNAVHEVLTNHTYRNRAQQLHQEIEAAPGLEGFTRLVEEVVAKHHKVS